MVVIYVQHSDMCQLEQFTCNYGDNTDIRVEICTKSCWFQTKEVIINTLLWNTKRTQCQRNNTDSWKERVQPVEQGLNTDKVTRSRTPVVRHSKRC